MTTLMYRLRSGRRQSDWRYMGEQDAVRYRPRCLHLWVKVGNGTLTNSVQRDERADKISAMFLNALADVDCGVVLVVVHWQSSLDKQGGSGFWQASLIYRKLFVRHTYCLSTKGSRWQPGGTS